MDITILGAGIAGLTSAIALQQAGHKVTLFEAAKDIRGIGAGIVLAANAMQVYQRLGMQDKIVARGRQLKFFNVASQTGRILTRADSADIAQRYGVNNFTIHRGDLHAVLLAELGSTPIHADKRAMRVTQAGDGVQVHFADGSSHTCTALVVGDGIHSAIRKQLAPGSHERYAGYTCWRAVVDVPGLDLHEATETWGPRGRFGTVPLQGNKVYWFACVNAPAQDPNKKAWRVADLQNCFAAHHAPIPTILAATRDTDLLWNDILDLAPLDHFAYGRCVLIGDAAHATTPNMGQGACQAIEDAYVLAGVLSQQPDPVLAFQAFESRRLPRTRWIVENSWRFGKVAQWENGLACALRDFAVRMVPNSMNARTLKRLYEWM
jgi:2-polyprenyl-6-methoxyphenol hydroxylase-like FAD-dependent oxidoreductase